MSDSPQPGSFEDFLRWLAESSPPADADLAPPSSDVLAAANLAWRETQSLRSAQWETLGPHFGQGFYQEDVELMAAADLENGGHPLPRLRTPNGFVISALYGTNSMAAGTAPIALLVECPVASIELFKGLRVQVLAGDRWVDIGEIDADGKATGDLPDGVDFKPPFALRVGTRDLDPAEPKGPEHAG
jgi:hypothetical protein